MKKMFRLLLVLMSMGTCWAQAQPSSDSTPQTLSNKTVNCANNTCVLVASNLLSPLATGTSQGVVNNRAALLEEISKGTSGSPDGTAGPLVKISRTQLYTSPACTSSVETDCAAPFSVQVVSLATDYEQATAIYGAATTASVTSPGAVAGVFQGVVTGSATGIATGLFVVGQRSTNTGTYIGAEIRGSNNTSTDCTVSYNSVPCGDGVWLSTGGTFKSGSALQTATNALWLEGLTLNNGSVANIAINDETTATTSIEIGGAHTNALLSASGSGKWGFGTVSPGGFFDVEAGTAAASTAGLNSVITAQNGSSAAGGSIFLEPGGGSSNGNLIVQALGASGTTAIQLRPASTAGQANLNYSTPGGATNWILGQAAAASNPQFFLYDNNGGRYVLQANENGTLALMPGGGATTMGGGLTVASATLIGSSVTLTNNAAAQVATITNGPTAGNPTKWFPINDNGTTRNVPAW